MDELMDLLITKKISGRRLSEREEKILETWLESDIENRKQFFQLKLIYNQEDPATLGHYKEEVWNKLNESPVQLDKEVFTIHAFLSWAAVILLVSSLLFIFYDRSSDKGLAVNYIEKVSLPGKKITTLLPDGTQVKLNSASKLIIPEKFSANERRVKLLGEAFFDVARNESKPFIIETTNFQVKVLGTSFNVKAYDDGSVNQVAVKTGKVSVEALSGNAMKLAPDQMVEVSKDDLSDITGFDALYVFGWTDQKLVFKDNRIDEVFLEIEKWFNVEIVSKHLVKSDELFTGAFENATINEVMLSVSKAFKFNYEIKQNKIRIIE